MLAGALVAVMPFLGFPASFDTVIFFVLGVVVISLGIIVRRRGSMMSRRGSASHMNSEDARTETSHDEMGGN